MLILGLHGNLTTEDQGQPQMSAFHDAAAVLVQDGEVIAAVEEERLSRQKFTTDFPLRGIAWCLKHAGVRAQDLDLIAINASEWVFDEQRRFQMLFDSSVRWASGRQRVADMVSLGVGADIDPAKLRFVRHHTSHAYSAFIPSGFSDALVISLDGKGENDEGGADSGFIGVGRGHEVQPIKYLGADQSIGLLYGWITVLLGYRMGDEFKVMGLAPYGDPKPFEAFLQQLYTLKPDGDIWVAPMPTLLKIADEAGLLRSARRKGEPFEQRHKDLAAALQVATERLVLHVVTHYRKQTGLNRLCLAGGVAHNCVANGKVMATGLFEDIFIQPASHDAGGALGAAYAAMVKEGYRPAPTRMRNMNLGPDIGSNEEIASSLAPWSGIGDLRVEGPFPDIERRAAALIAEGKVIAWVQGRSEFGPRALGYRSILADPRPAENKQRINQMVKKREGYRPFAPSVLADHVGEYFEVPENFRELPFMICVVPVLPRVRELLGAITHVDGTARVQTVSREVNGRYWSLIDHFRQLTGVPIVLNTSFNNNAEPVVDSVDDAVTCFLTTGIDSLVIGDYLVEKSRDSGDTLLRLAPTLSASRQLVRQRTRAGASSVSSRERPRDTARRGCRSPRSPTMSSRAATSRGSRCRHGWIASM